MPDAESPSPRPSSTRLLAAALALSLSLMLACGLAVAVAAISAFGTLAERGALLPGLEAFAAADPAASGRLVAGLVMDRVFAITDAAQLVLAPLTVVLAVVLAVRCRGGSGGATSGWILGVVLVATGLVLVHSLLVAPPMQASLAEHRDLVAAGRFDDAVEARAAFDARHLIADRLYGMRLLAVAAALLLILLLPAGPRR